MGIKLIRVVDRMAVRRVGDCHRSPPSGKTGRNDSSNLHRRSSPLSKSACLSPPALPSRRNFRSSEKNSGGDRSKSLMVEKPPAKNLVMENVVILKRQSVSKNHQQAESVTPPSSSPEKPVGGAAPDRCSANQIQGEMENVVILKRQSVSKNHQPAESVTLPSSTPEKPVGGAAPDRCSANQIQGELEVLLRNISPVSRKPQLYAGSGFFTSPAPSSLPKPSFFEKKEVASSVDLATTSLTFLLCLDVV